MAEGQEGSIPNPNHPRRNIAASRQKIIRGRKMTPAERDQDLAKQNPAYGKLLDRIQLEEITQALTPSRATEPPVYTQVRELVNRIKD